MITPDAKGLYHPANNGDITTLIQYAVQNKLQVRVRGAAQSVNAAVVTDAGNNINMELDQLRSVVFDDAAMQVTVGAGCNLGVDPYDPSETSSLANSFLQQLSLHGWAIANVPDAIHQTVGGFISTGSSGPSMQHSFDECIVAITLIDGTGNLHTFTKSENLSDPFYAVGTSMGLLGIITAVTLQCIPAFNIIGSQSTTKISDCAYDFLGNGGNGKQSLQQMISNTEFTRMLWWPFVTVQRMITWQAHTMQASDYNQHTGTPQQFTPKSYQPVFKTIGGSALPMQAAAAEGYKLIATWPNWLHDLTGNSPAEPVIETITEQVAPYLYPLVLNMFFACDSDKNPPQQFWDNWLGSLPMDRVEFSNNLFNMCYTEIWVAADKTQELMSTFQQHYQQGGFAATWIYCVEVLAAKQSNFWMSPGYGQNSVRISIMWWLDNPTQPLDYYQQFWDLLYQKNIPFRLHWGKYLPPAASNEGPAYLQQQYPQWNNFMALRKQLDPDNLFLTTYWKTQLGIMV
ncbi:MAG: D-arabinono-1,4-lactone oxidase [Ferruginibacter sp.]